MKTFRAMTRAQALAFLRDRQTLFWTLAFPLMFLFLFGALNSDQTTNKYDLAKIGNVPIIDQAPDQAKDALDDLFTISEATDREATIAAVRKGDKDAAVLMEGDQLVVYYSAADQVRSAVILGTLDSFVQGANQAITGVEPTFSIKSEQVEDARLKPIQYIAPGLLGWAIVFGAVLGAAMQLVQWRQTKMLRRLRLTPTSTSAIVSSRTVIQMVICLVQVALFLGFGALLFDLQLTDNWWLSIPFVLLASITFLNLGLLVGSVSKTPDGASGLANVIVLPMAFLSGAFFPLEFGPGWLNTVSYAMPLRYVNEGLMDVLVRGAGVEALWLPSAVLIGLAAVFGLIAAQILKRSDTTR